MAKFFKYIPLFLFFSGCQNYITRTEVGIGKSFLASDLITSNGSGHRTSILHKSFYVGFPYEFKQKYALDTFFGPSTALSLDGNHSFGSGLDLCPRLRYKYWSGIEPYFSGRMGFHYFDEKLGKQGTNWGFTLGIGPGVNIKINRKTWLSLQYQMWHFSNGSSIFGSPGPNPGQNSDIVIFGIEQRF